MRLTGCAAHAAPAAGINRDPRRLKTQHAIVRYAAGRRLPRRLKRSRLINPS